ncbi:MAG: M56 family metallopeptidase, partial [Hominisplanchenecus sp.]|nr:M56 family metallopeptidase [Hominisplanchenecus sp.]
MRITPVSVLMAVLWSGILIGMVYWMRRKSQYVRKFGITCIIMVYLFCIVRVLFPIDFSFTRGIPLRGAFSDVYHVLWMEKYTAAGFDFYIGTVLCGIWIVVSMLLLLHFGLEYRSMCSALKKLSVREDDQCTDLLCKVFEETGKKHRVMVCKDAGICMPMGIGIRQWHILLPNQEYTDEELYYILLHEYTHFLNGDLVIKILVHIYCCIFWWNPFVYLLKKDLDQSLEIKCDLCVTENMSYKDTADYLQTIVSSLKAMGKNRQFAGINNSVSLGQGSRNEVLERFKIVQKNKERSIGNVKQIVTWMCVFVITMIASYSFVPMPSYDPPKEEIETGPDVYEITPDNSYIIQKNGKYYWRVEGVPDEEITEEFAQELSDSGF